MNQRPHASIALMTLCSIFLIALSSCEKMDDAAQQTDANAKSINDYSRVFPPKAVVLGKTREEWMVEWYRWYTRFDCAHAPGFDTTGVLQNQNQPNGVFFLAGKKGTWMPLQVTVPSGKRIFLSMPNIMALYPSAYIGTPAPDQTLEEYLKIRMDNILSNTSGNYMLLDSDSLNLDGYQTWTGLFTFYPNPDLRTCWLNSLNPQGQECIAGGNFVMLKPLSPGWHTIKKGGFWGANYSEWNYLINQQ